MRSKFMNCCCKNFDDNDNSGIETVTRVLDQNWFDEKWTDIYHFERDWFYSGWIHRYRFGKK